MNKLISILSALFIVGASTSVCCASDELALEPVTKKSCVADEDADASLSIAPLFPVCAMQRDTFRKILAQSDVLALGSIAMASKGFATVVEQESKRRCEQWGVATYPSMFDGMLTPWLSCYANEFYFRELLIVNVSQTIHKIGVVCLPTDEQKILLNAFVKYYRKKAFSISVHIALGASSTMDDGEKNFWDQWAGRCKELTNLNGFSLRHEFCLARDCCRDRDNIWWFSSELNEGPAPTGMLATYAYLVAGIRATHGSLQCISPYLLELYSHEFDVTPALKITDHPLFGPKFSRNFLDSVVDEYMAHIPAGTISYQQAQGLTDLGEEPDE
jgi:hypothetical protein